MATGSAQLAGTSNPIKIPKVRADRRRRGYSRSTISGFLELEHLFARIPLSRRTQVQLVELLDRRRRCRNYLVVDGSCGSFFHVHASWGEEKGNRDGCVGQSGTVSPFGWAKVGKASGDTSDETHQSGFFHRLLALGLMKFAKEILPVTLFRTLMALEG